VRDEPSQQSTEVRLFPYGARANALRFVTHATPTRQLLTHHGPEGRLRYKTEGKRRVIRPTLALDTSRTLCTTRTHSPSKRGAASLFRLAKDDDILSWDIADPAIALSQKAHRVLSIEDHMRGVTPVMPTRKSGIIGLKTCHQPEDTPGPKQFIQTPKLVTGTLKMLHRFGRYDEIVAAFKDLCIGRKKRIVQRNVMPCLFQHRSQQRARAATKVQAFGSRFEALKHRLGEGPKKGSIAGILLGILVKLVDRPFRIAVQPIRRVQKGELAARTAPVALGIHPKQEETPFLKTQGARRRLGGLQHLCKRLQF
jgi:hypothetical protein